MIVKARLLALIVLSAASAAMSDEVFRDKTCPVQFAFPAGWEYQVNPESRVFSGTSKSPKGVVCTIGLRPARWAATRNASPLRLPTFPLTIAVIHRPFLEVAHDAGFRRMREIYEPWETVPLHLSDLRADDWTVPMRQGEAPATQQRTHCCQVVRGDTWGNTEAKDGSKATFNNELVVLNDRHKHTAVMETETHSADDFRIVTDLVIRSFRFEFDSPD